MAHDIKGEVADRRCIRESNHDSGSPRGVSIQRRETTGYGKMTIYVTE